VDTSGPLSHVVAEIDGTTNTLEAVYIRGGDELLWVMRPDTGSTSGWQTRFYAADGIGSVRRLTDEAAAVTDTYTYSAFGELLVHTGTDPQPYAFTGEPYDPNVGFQYHRARWMDPRLGRFLGMDPWEGNAFDPPSLHRYLYVADNPVSGRDPSGKFSVVELGMVALVVGLLYSAYRGLSTAVAGGTRAQVAKAEAEAFLVGAAVGATVYAVIWGGVLAYIGAATGGVTFSPQIYNAYRSAMRTT
jgi:RHS repeat-associated protein